MASEPEATTNPYAPPRADLRRKRGESDPLRLAERGTRLGASLLDGLLFGLIAVVGIVAVAVLADLPEALGIALGLAGAAIYGIYNVVLLTTRGQTVGKRMLGIKIVRTDGAPAGFSRAVALRIFVPIAISWAITLLLSGPEALAAAAKPATERDITPGEIASSLFGFVGLLLIFGSARRCLHDYIAGTIVVKA